jgi:hypothetical protein
MSLIVDTLQQIGGAAGKRLEVFSYQESFASLWKMVATSAESGEPRTIVMVWDNIPKGNTGAVNTTRYLTPLDWLVAFCLRQGAGACNWRFRILDLGSHLAGNANALVLLPLLENVLAGFSFYRLARAPEFIDALLETEGQTVAWDLTQNHLDLLRQIWTANLTRNCDSDDHHALFNLLGPQLLLKNPSQGKEIDVSALRILMETVGLLPQGVQGGAKLLDGTVSWIDPGISCKSALRLILVDDQWRDGWGEVVCRAVGHSFQQDAMPEATGLQKIDGDSGNKVAVFAAGSAEWLLRKLEADSGDHRFRFRLNEDGPEVAEGEKAEEILLLDLRLFSGQGSELERNHIARLVAIAKQIMASQRVLPWPGFDDLVEIERWLAEGQQNNAHTDPRYHKALTLLPRILAWVDLSLPIIIFSSTGRREIVKEFEQYCNIITIFEKPRFQGQEHEDLTAQVGAQFRAAIERALEFIEGRRICALLSRVPPLKSVAQTPSPQGEWTVDVYVDETGVEVDKNGFPTRDKPLRVGGLVAIFPPNKHPDDFNRRLSENFSASRLETKKGLRQSAEEQLEWITAQPDKPCHLMQFGLTGTLNDELVGGEDLERFNMADNLYLELARNGIEIALYHLARHQLPPEAPISCRVHMATRHIPVKGYTDYCSNLFERFGVSTVWVGNKGHLWEASRLLAIGGEFQDLSGILEQRKQLLTPPPQRIRYLGFDSIRSLVHDIDGHYRLSPFRPRLDHARSYVLPGGEDERLPKFNKTNPRALHLLADAILSPGTKGPQIEKIYDAGFDEQFDRPLQILIHGARLASCGQRADALACVGETVAEFNGKLAERRGEAILLVALRQAAEIVTGEEFCFFLARRKEREGRATLTMEGLVVLRSYKGDTIEIANGVRCVVDRRGGVKQPVLGIGDTVLFKAVDDYTAGERFVTDIIEVAPHPLWKTLAIGQEYRGKVVNVARGNFCIIDLGGTTGSLKEDDTVLKKGEEVLCRVTHLNKSSRQIFLQRASCPAPSETNVSGCGTDNAPPP